MFLQRPNIVLIATDGLDAERMSVYGCKRDTTPFIREFTERKSLFCENAFSNATISASSIASMLTGKLSTRTRLYYPPDILKGQDAYQHLPGILRGYGYRNIEFGLRYYADSHDMNMINSFDEANFRKINKNRWAKSSNSDVNNAVYFLNQLQERLQTRFNRMNCKEGIKNPFNIVTGEEVIPYSNNQILNQFMRFIDGSPSPFFAHIHLMGTHGPKFFIENPVFSYGQEQNGFMMNDFFDDAILEFDLFFKKMINSLESRGKIENTVFVIHTDHAMEFEKISRLPLIFIFPDQAYSGKISSNVQNIDIPVTLLDYIGIPTPFWMKGQSLISRKIDRMRPVFITSHMDPKFNERGLLSANKKFYNPPYYNLGKIFMIICNNYYELDLNSMRLKVDKVKGHTDPCGNNAVLGKEEIIRRINELLRKSGYDTLESPNVFLR
ncbi:sulfatase-like hydrolase/transferase [Thermodesulfobacteriota bacterium]